jgi:ATP-binding cassette subfamily F protein uup
MDLRSQKKDLQSDKRGSMTMAVESSGTSGKRVVEAKHVTKKFGDRVIVEDFSTRILRGDRVALVGPNGAGKTTLVRMLLGELPIDSGDIKLGTNLEISYVDQNRMALSDKITLWDFLTPGGGDSILVRGIPKLVAGYAKEFLFTEAQLRQPVTSLSGGERNRLLLARALATPTNLMVLDEPTNDLDMDTLDLLEELLADFEGTLILVSHDRDFIDRLATSTIAMNGHGVVLETPGGWSDLIDQSPDFFKGARGAAGDFATGTGSNKAIVTPTAPPKKSGKLSYKDQRRLEECEALIAASPQIIADLEVKLEDSNFYARDPVGFDKVMKAIDKARADLATAEEDWLALEEKRETMVG